MASYSATTQRACTQILTRVRLVAPPLICKRHQSTFSFFSRSQDNPPAHIQTSNTQLHQPSAKPSSLANPNALKTSPSFSNAAPLLEAIQNKDQDTAWMVYSALSRANQLSSLLPIHFTLLLRSIRPANPLRFYKTEADQLIERLEQVWAEMLQCKIQPDVNDYTARLELFVATRQFQLVDQTWTQMRKQFGPDAGNVSKTSSALDDGRLIQPTLYTFNLVLQSCVFRKNIDLAMETMKLMKRAGVKPDNMSWDYILQIHTAKKNWAAVESTFRSAFIATAATGSSYHYALPPGQHDTTKNLMVIPLGQRAKSLHGGVLMPPNHRNNNQDNQDKLIPTIQNVHTLFSYYAHTRDLEDLRAMFDSHVRLFGIVPTTRTYNEMIKYAFLMRRDEDAVDLFKELVQIGQNIDRVQQEKGHGDHEVPGVPGDDMDASSGSDIQQQADLARRASSPSSPIPMQVCGPDFKTFSVLINNELIASRNRWGRAWRWIQIMQKDYGFEPSDTMFRRTLASMKRRRANEATVQTVRDNWQQVLTRIAERSR
ncbi:hypothetical protein BG011_008851 [Mortierella polycephala]|uniref:Uncharacterized protein n=1 Tax=Mortierella polycephala TaxID=41804 RepID=A0A9P6PPS2_9FUNG|nr:hypothetical protein BG011_008851 [Mortierella polycephala]